jgi:hypothetical protein
VDCSTLQFGGSPSIWLAPYPIQHEQGNTPWKPLIPSLDNTEGLPYGLHVTALSRATGLRTLPFTGHWLYPFRSHYNRLFCLLLLIPCLASSSIPKVKENVFKALNIILLTDFIARTEIKISVFKNFFFFYVFVRSVTESRQSLVCIGRCPVDNASCRRMLILVTKYSKCHVFLSNVIQSCPRHGP